MITYSSYSSPKTQKVFPNTVVQDTIIWRYDTQNIVATRGLRVLKRVSGTIYLSVDGGITYPYSKAVTGLAHIKFAYICANGDLAFATPDKFYRSTDNLTTVTEIHPLNITGGTYVCMADCNYDQIGISNFMDTTLGDPILWGNYEVINLAGVGSWIGDNINLWYTIDNFTTVKSCYYFTPSDTNNNCAHVHNATRHPDGSYWVHCGDGKVNSNARWLKGIYNASADTWSWNVIESADGAGDIYFASGIGFNGGNVFWCCDDQSASHNGIMKSAEADLFQVNKATRIFATSNPLCFLLMVGDNVIIACSADLQSAANTIVISKDNGVNCELVTLTGATIPANMGFWTIRPKNDDGWYFMQIAETSPNESYCDARSVNANQVNDNGVIWVKIL
jgi:hypothetical protein